MKIIYLPLENLEHRYTTMMNDVVRPYVDIYLYPKIKIPDRIKDGEFLDTIQTCKFKAAQLKMVSELFEQGKVENGDVFFVADAFYPGIEMIPYMAGLLDLKVKVAAFNHAGFADPDDFVQKIEDTMSLAEKSWNNFYSRVFVGSSYHKANADRYFGNLWGGKVVVTGAIWDADWVLNKYHDKKGSKEDYVIWPHRISFEKDYNLFLKIVAYNPDIKFKVPVQSKGPHPDILPNLEMVFVDRKVDYLKLLSRAAIYLSTAKQETFGYTLQEALLYDCHIVVPNRASYRELIDSSRRYSVSTSRDSLYESRELLLASRNSFLNKEKVDNKKVFSGAFTGNVKTIIQHLKNL